VNLLIAEQDIPKSAQIRTLVVAQSTENIPETDTGSDSGSESGTQDGTGSDSGSESGTQDGTGSDSGSESGTQDGTGSDSGSESGTQDETGVKTETGSETQNDTGIETGDDTETELETGTDTDVEEIDPEGYATNNQVIAVEEADIIKTDGNFIYLSYRDVLIVLNRQGSVLDRFVLPDPKTTESGSFLIFDNPTTDVLLFKENRILAISIGYRSEEPTLVEKYTRILLLDIAADGKLTLAEDRFVPGSHMRTRGIDGHAYIAVLANLNHSLLTNALMRENFSESENYREAATAKAKTLLPQWSQQVLDSLLGNKSYPSSSACKQITKISFMTQGDFNNVADPLDFTEGKGRLNCALQIARWKHLVLKKIRVEFLLSIRCHFEGKGYRHGNRQMDRLAMPQAYIWLEGLKFPDSSNNATLDVL